MRSVSLMAIGALTFAGLLGTACGGDGDDDGTGGTGGEGTGGEGTGGDGTGGDGTGGDGTGGDGTGGDGTGGDGTGGMGTGGTGGMGGMGGAMATGGMGGMAPVAPCSGCVELFVPLTAADEGTVFEIDLGSEVDMSGTEVAFNVQVITDGNAGGLQQVPKNADYTSVYTGWTNFTDAEGSFIDVSVDVGAQDGDGGFDASAVQFVGLEVSAGEDWDGAMWGDTYVYVDSITFSDGSTADLDFSSDAGGMYVNEGASFVEGSTVTYVP